MKRYLPLIVLAYTCVFVGMGINSVMNSSTKTAVAQLPGENYLWADSIKTTTAAQDSHFTVRWEQVTVYSDTIDVWYRLGSPDTASWSSRDWIFLDAGASISFGPATRLYRMEWKSAAGTGYLFLQGYKRSKQF